MWHLMDLVFRSSLPRNFGLGEPGTGGKEFRLEELTELSIGINGQIRQKLYL